MIDPRTQHEVPSGDDAPERAWHNRLSDSIHDILTFATLDDANAWAAEPGNAPFALAGRHAWISAENAVYVRSGGQWRMAWQDIAATANVAVTVLGVAGTLSLVRSGRMANAYISVVNGATAQNLTPGSLIPLPAGWATSETRYFHPTGLTLLAVAGSAISSQATQTWAANARLTISVTYPLVA